MPLRATWQELGKASLCQRVTCWWPAGSRPAARPPICSAPALRHHGLGKLLMQPAARLNRAAAICLPDGAEAASFFNLSLLSLG